MQLTEFEMDDDEAEAMYDTTNVSPSGDATMQTGMRDAEFNMPTDGFIGDHNAHVNGEDFEPDDEYVQDTIE